ncbi:hypothetical protein TNIN_152431 [Trichonephila inaurata madagascariensis]|uniref:Uncharacterized protein n=1 Tax=Trichonephila inaurata madagascariensis TaxID=2747483 RepID=A0A8X6YDT6_9ARAC|nr:hypothetical protein TNIN_152431 [Trichonephila inaurata madagascariensis]
MESEVAKEKVAAKLQVDDTTIRDTGLTLLQEDDTAIPDIGLELKKMTYEFEEMLKKRLADSEKVVFDTSGLIFWPLVIVIVFALMFPFYYQAR